MKKDIGVSHLAMFSGLPPLYRSSEQVCPSDPATGLVEQMTETRDGDLDPHSGFIWFMREFKFENINMRGAVGFVY